MTVENTAKTDINPKPKVTTSLVGEAKYNIETDNIETGKHGSAGGDTEIGAPPYRSKIRAGVESSWYL